MAHGDPRKCKCCLKLFRPDPRDLRHQSYRFAPTCKAASKAASQAGWLAKPENQDYFRGPVNTARVKAWRARHPGYWRKRQHTGGVGGANPSWDRGQICREIQSVGIRWDSRRW